MVILASSLPSLTDLQLGSNSITSLSSSASTSEIFASLTSINLEANEISSWDEICNSLGTLPSSVDRLVSTTPRISLIVEVDGQITENDPNLKSDHTNHSAALEHNIIQKPCISSNSFKSNHRLESNRRDPRIIQRIERVMDRR